MADNEEELVDYDEEEVRTEDRDGPAWSTTDPRPDRSRVWIFGVARNDRHTAPKFSYALF
jgi:hypothetical protein